MDRDRIIKPTASFDHGRLVFDLPDTELRGLIDRGHLVFAKVWPEEEVMELRRRTLQWMARQTPFPIERSASLPGFSFYRRDEERLPTSIPHVFDQVALHQGSHGDPELWSRAAGLIEPLLELQNRLAGTRYAFADPLVRIKIINHPVGGGHFATHVHRYEPMKVAFFLSLSRPGRDCSQGGLEIDAGGRLVNLTALLPPGWAVVFRYDLRHCVTPVDPDRQRDWSGETGCWLAAIELSTEYPVSLRL